MNFINYIWNFAKNLFSYNQGFSMEIDENIFNYFSETESLPQFNKEIKIIQLQYSPIHQKLMDIFRYIINTNEISLRVFNLTTELIKISPWTYEVWVIRRKCLSEIEEINIYDEIEYVNNIIINYPKIFQIWHHRRLLIDKLNECSQEKKILDIILEEDSKNYHCWSHRIWMIRRFNNIEGEFEFVEKMLNDDVKNNSAWNYRYFLVEYINKNNPDENIIKNEIKYAVNNIKICILNESAFNYINGLIIKNKKKYKDYKEIINELELLYDNEKKMNINNCVFILRMLLDYYEEDGNIKKFNDIIEQLINIDKIRKKYYSWRKKNFNNILCK